MKKLLFLALFVSIFTANSVIAQVSQVWNPDSGDGTYTNPVINADYSDPDVCKVGEDYYMVSSSFNCLPGLQILHSKDLIHWSIVGAAIVGYYPNEEWKEKVQHGKGVYAPSIRYHNGEYYIFYGDPEVGIFMTKTKDPRGIWSPLHLVKEGKGYIDTCPLWDEDGNTYLVFALSGSSIGYFNSVLCMAPLSEDGTHFLADAKVVYDGFDHNPVVEGPKLYKRGGFYYIFAPAGGVTGGWQLVLRSKNPYGPFEEKIVLAQGKTEINGPHQGAWVTTDSGEDWFFHFQDKKAYGRVVHLQPMVWIDNWPVIGVDEDGDGCGDPVLSYKKPNIVNNDKFNPQDSDEFNDLDLGRQWQWHGLSHPYWIFNDQNNGKLRMSSVPLPDNYTNLSSCHNLLLQKFPAEEFTVTTSLEYSPLNEKKGEDYGGLIVMGEDYATLAFQQSGDGLFLVMKRCTDALDGTQEEVLAKIPMKQNKIYARVIVEKDGVCKFSYSLDEKRYIEIGEQFKARQGKWIGAKVGLFYNRTAGKATRLDIDWFRFSKNR